MHNAELDRFERLIKGAEREAVSSIMVPLEVAQAVLARLVELEKLAKSVPFEVGDIVREVGEEELTGEIVQIKEGIDENAYIVKLYKPSIHFNSITFYEDEIELIERPGK